MPRLLFLSQTLPYPPDSGVKIRTFHTLRILSRDFDVTALCFYRRRQTAPGGVQAALSALGEYAEVEAFEIPQEWSRLRWIRDHVVSVARHVPYTDYVFDSTDFSRRLDELLAARDFDVVHFESSSLAAYADRVAHLPRVCVHHNVESQLLGRRADVARTPWAAAYLRLQAWLLRAAESRICPSMDLNVTVSEEDAGTFRSFAPDALYVTIPNGVDTEYFHPSEGPTEGVVLLGGTDWFPNLDGLEYFAEKVLPQIRAKRPDVRVVSVGRATDREIRRFREAHGIRLTGYVEDIRPFLRKARCVAVPLRVGGGSRLKILDSWAMGKAVVTTGVGCEGLNARDGETALIADSAGQLAAGLLRLLEDGDEAQRIGSAARRVAVDTYSWDALAGAMRAAYAEVLEHAARTNSPDAPFSGNREDE